MTKRTILRLCLVALLALVAWAGYYTLVGYKRVVVRTTTPNGIELCVVQNGSLADFETCVVYRHPGSPWGWFYYDHQDRYWDTARVETDRARSLITVFRDDHPALTFDYSTDTYTLVRWNRTVTGAQMWNPPSWQVPDP